MLYRVTTGDACFGIVVQDGVVVEAAPIVGKITGQQWAAVRGRYKYVELIPPMGWLLQQGMGGWRAVNRERKWSTNVFIEKAGGATAAVNATVELERKAGEELERRQTLCQSLRTYFSS